MSDNDNGYSIPVNWWCPHCNFTNRTSFQLYRERTLTDHCEGCQKMVVLVVKTIEATAYKVEGL